MNTRQAYIDGFVKRANEYGFNAQEALEMLKQAGKLPAATLAKKIKQPFNLGRSGTVNELGLHVPHDEGRFLDKILNRTGNPRVESQLDALRNQEHLDSIVASLSY